MNKLHRKMRLIFIIALLFLSSSYGLQGSDYDVYPSFSNDIEDEDRKPVKTSNNFPIGQTLVKLGATICMGSGVYVGYRIAQKILYKINKKSGSLIDINDINNTQYNITLINEMKKEQEELWRFIHSLFKNQEEMILKLDKKNDNVNVNDISDKIFKNLEESFDIKISNLSQKLNSLESKLKIIENKSDDNNRNNDILSNDNLRDIENIIKKETVDLSNSMVSLKKEIKNQMLKMLKENDDVVMEKIRFFGQDIKKLINNSDSSKSNGSGKSSSNFDTGSSKSSSSSNKNNKIKSQAQTKGK